MAFKEGKYVIAIRIANETSILSIAHDTGCRKDNFLEMFLNHSPNSICLRNQESLQWKASSQSKFTGVQGF
tara:strand:- start:45 stop:257 length:213 start_codon:yes stop_codon:yes gene_type:complete